MHREALKQSATDPSSGKIDISILTTGVSNTARRRRMEIGQSLRKMLQAKSQTTKTFNYAKVFEDLKAQSNLVSFISSLCLGDSPILFLMLIFFSSDDHKRYV